MKYLEDFINKIICGDCIEVMKGFPDNCIDTIITDPPYGLEFMGKDWDKFGGKPIDRSKEDSSLGIHRYFKGNKPIYNWDMSEYYKFAFNWATEALRVAKPGATLLCFGGTRTYHRLACAIEDAGWIIKDCIMWLYGSGFPKATDISKQIDKGAGRKRKIIGRYTDANGNEYKQTGNRKNFTSGNADEIENCKDDRFLITAPATPEAILWNGWKSHGLKPAYEPILVAMKPNEGSYANNALKWGVAGINVDGGRIPYEDKGDFKNGHHNKQLSDNVKYKKTIFGSTFGYGLLNSNINKGRYPANVILNEESARMLDEQAPKTGAFAKVKSGHSGKSKGIYHDYAQRGDDGATFYSDGLQGASRFFYCAKASKRERNMGCEGLERKSRANINKMMGEAGNFKTGSGNIRTVKFKNHHPTVKPLALMIYLVKLTLMPNKNQIYLDPFFGSGTTGIACKKLDRKYIGIDNKEEYCEISRKRIKAIPELLF